MSETAGTMRERVPRLAGRVVHTAFEYSVDGSAGRSVLLIGPGELPDATQLALHTAAARVIRLSDPSDGDIRRALSEHVDSVIVISRDDAVALRLALIVEYIRPGMPLIVTVHSRIVAAQLERAVDNIRVTSMAKIVAPTLAAPCIDDRLLWVGRTAEGFCAVQADDGGPQLVEIEASGPRRSQRMLANMVSLIRPFEPSARILTIGAFGFLLILVLDTVATILVLGLSLRRARALAAVTSHEVENISISVAALGMHEDLRTILRAGRGEVTNETRSLFSIGVVRDVYRIGGTLLAAAALGSDAREAFLHEHTVYLITPDFRIEAFEADAQALNT